LFNPFYFSTIRKYVSLFGTLFNNIRITRTDADGKITDLIRVPITYGPKEKMLARVTQDPNIDKQAAMQLPVMSFEMVGFEYDGKRKLTNVGKVFVADPANPNIIKYQYNPVPYNIGFKLSVYVKNAEDGSKIIEQILPYFTPDWTTTIFLIPEMNVTMDIPIIMNNIQMQDTYDGDFKDRRALIWTLDFTLKGYFYGPVKTSKVIKFANTEFFVPSGPISSAVGVTSPSAHISIQPGLQSNGAPTSNSALSIPVADIIATDNFGFVTDIKEP
jgi:hypothetical protein